MNKYMIGSKALRMTFIVIGLFISLGIWLTGIDLVHWILFYSRFSDFAGVS